MIGYVTLGTNDLEKAGEFYDAVLGEIGVKRLLATDRFIMWGTSFKAPALSLTKPFDGNPATPGNGTMAAIVVDATAKVDALHGKAMSLGAKDEGAPGPRGSQFYCGYVRDPDGNKLNFFCTL